MRPRDHLVRALQADLVGPYQLDEDSIAEQELLELPPSRHYLTGFLAPEGHAEPEVEEDDDLDTGPDDGEDDAAGTGAAGAGARRQQHFPVSLGVSLLVPKETTSLEVIARFAEYAPETQPGEGKRRGPRGWRRSPLQTHSLTVELAALARGERLRLRDASGVVVEGQVREVDATVTKLPPGTRAVSLFLVNRRPMEDMRQRDRQSLFQVVLEVACAEGIVPRPNVADEARGDWDERVADLQFRTHCEWAVGHNVAVELPEEESRSAPKRLRTTWIPRQSVHRVRAHHDKDVQVAMEELAELKDAAEVREKLGALPTKYLAWIEQQRKDASVGGGLRAAVQDELMQHAQAACERIRKGIELCAEDKLVRRAFCLANRAMAAQARRRKPEDFQGGARPEWRLFQLGFLLLNLDGLANELSPERECVELIFFPTGGGKTEAYLGVIAYTLILRRLRRAKLADAGLGVAVLLRYTLRLLTLDQLDRAASLVCALESERKKVPAELGEERFSVGLWVGKSATANTLEEVQKLVTKYKIGEGKSPFPLAVCPWCRTELTARCMEVLKGPEQEGVRVICQSESCEFAGGNDAHGLPVVFVDEQVYRELPSFLIATVDKFAMMPWRGEIGMLFGKVTARERRKFFGPLDAKVPKTAKVLKEGVLPPDLIVQDELHLISGPLGTMVGLYETAIDSLCSRSVANPSAPEGRVQVRPKVLAATATVRRAHAQIQALYGRGSVSVFPPPGIDDSETFFSEVDTESLGRLYVGVAAQGRSLKNISQRVYRTLLTAAKKVYDPEGPEAQEADGYMTLAGYFNSLRELGGMRRIVEEEVRDRARKAESVQPSNAVGPHLWFRNRDIGLEPVELTSREHTSVVKSVRDRLGHPHRAPDAIQVLLASNMISVGVDIDRLGLMVIAGQPKTTAEYIQASSRVGRSTKWPGLVVTLYNLHKPRDRSHYEHFEAYHRSFYRYVEATSVTPFSGPALERGLAGVIAAMTRFGHPDMTPGKAASDITKHRKVADAAVHAIAARAGGQPHQSQGGAERARHDLEHEGKNLLDHWASLVSEKEGVVGQRRYSPFDRDKTGGAPLLKTSTEAGAEDPSERRFVAPTSMRDVESAAHLWVVGRRFGGGS